MDPVPAGNGATLRDAIRGGALHRFIALRSSADLALLVWLSLPLLVLVLLCLGAALFSRGRMRLVVLLGWHRTPGLRRSRALRRRLLVALWSAGETDLQALPLRARSALHEVVTGRDIEIAAAAVAALERAGGWADVGFLSELAHGAGALSAAQSARAGAASALAGVRARASAVRAGPLLRPACGPPPQKPPQLLRQARSPGTHAPGPAGGAEGE